MHTDLLRQSCQSFLLLLHFPPVPNVLSLPERRHSSVKRASTDKKADLSATASRSSCISFSVDFISACFVRSFMRASQDLDCLPDVTRCVCSSFQNFPDSLSVPEPFNGAIVAVGVLVVRTPLSTESVFMVMICGNGGIASRRNFLLCAWPIFCTWAVLLPEVRKICKTTNPEKGSSAVSKLSIGSADQGKVGSSNPPVRHRTLRRQQI